MLCSFRRFNVDVCSCIPTCTLPGTLYTGTAKRVGATTQSDDTCTYTDSRWGKPGTMWATEQLAQSPQRRPHRFSIHQRLTCKTPHGSLRLELYSVRPCSKEGKRYRRAGTESRRTLHGQVALRGGKIEIGVPEGKEAGGGR